MKNRTGFGVMMLAPLALCIHVQASDISHPTEARTGLPNELAGVRLGWNLDALKEIQVKKISSSDLNLPLPPDSKRMWFKLVNPPAAYRDVAIEVYAGKVKRVIATHTREVFNSEWWSFMHERISRYGVPNGTRLKAATQMAPNSETMRVFGSYSDQAEWQEQSKGLIVSLSLRITERSVKPGTPARLRFELGGEVSETLWDDSYSSAPNR